MITVELNIKYFDSVLVSVNIFHSLYIYACCNLWNLCVEEGSLLSVSISGIRVLVDVSSRDFRVSTI